VTGLDAPWTFHDVPMVQLLSPEGRRVEHPDFPLRLADDEYRALYRDMTLARRLDIEATALQRQGEIGMWIPSLGQEGAQIGAGHALRPPDHVFPSYRQHGLGLCRGLDPVDLLSLFRGVTHSGWDGERHRFHPYTIVVGAQAPHAVGYAMGMARDGSPGAVLACLGDGATSQGDVSEALTFAAVYGAPVVFFCENNQWAISVPVTQQAVSPLYRRAAGFGFPGIQVDGNDVLACRAVVRAALELAGEGNGPIFIEAVTYRSGPHTTADQPDRYRDPAETQGWAARDPINRMREFLRALDLIDAAYSDDLRQQEDALAARLRAGVRALPDPDASQLFEHVYAAPHPLVEEERAELLDYLASFETADALAAGSGTEGRDG
jgi:2-oxoisovalerate dehydrogenase E1 component alpha subunit